MPAMHGCGCDGFDRITVGGEIGRRIEITIANNLLQLDIEHDFLAPLRKKTGAFVGIGMLLNTMTRLAAFSGDQRVAFLRDNLVAALIQLQDPSGYIGTKAQEKRLWEAFDVDEVFQILSGLVAHYRLTRNAGSLAGATRLGRFVLNRFSTEPEEAAKERWLCDTLLFLGLELGLLDLYAVCNEKTFLDFCVQQRRLHLWRDPIVLGRWGKLEGHAYAYLVKCLAQLHLNRFAPDRKLFEQSHKLLDFLTQSNGMVITGAMSEWECWHNTQEGGWNLGETCASAYLIYLLDKLLRLEGDALYGDLMERIIYNTLFAAQSPDGRRLRYNTAFDGPRTYYEKDAYCCPNNYRLAVSRLPEFIYYPTRNGIRVNLYTDSIVRCRFPSGMVTIEQTTNYPNSGLILLRIGVETPMRFALSLRLPRWCSTPEIVVAGKRVEDELLVGRESLPLRLPEYLTWRHAAVNPKRT